MSINDTHIPVNGDGDGGDNPDDKGTCHLRFSGIRPLRGYPPPLLTENQSEKKKVFFLSGKGGYPPPLTESPLSFSGKFFPKRAKNDVFFIK